MSWMCLSRETPSLPSRKERRREGRKGTIGTRIGTSSFCPSSLHSPPFSNWLAWRDLALRPPPASRADVGHSQLQQRPREEGGCTTPLDVLVLVFGAEMSFPLGLLSVSVSMDHIWCNAIHRGILLNREGKLDAIHFVKVDGSK